MVSTNQQAKALPIVPCIYLHGSPDLTSSVVVHKIGFYTSLLLPMVLYVSFIFKGTCYFPSDYHLHSNSIYTKGLTNPWFS
uniref:Uncharacterized protein n=1 Tax=Leersia perrieri TaxID=77586 RepID=A0A0D9XYH0_9ORYZ